MLFPISQIFKKSDISHIPYFPAVKVIEKNKPVDGVCAVRVQTYWDQARMRSVSTSRVEIKTCVVDPEDIDTLSAGQVVWAVPFTMKTTPLQHFVIGDIPVSAGESLVGLKISLAPVTPNIFLNRLSVLHFETNTRPFLEVMS